MSFQLEFPPSTYAARSSPTSVAGAEATRYRAGSQVARVLEYIRSEGPVTDKEISAGVGLPLATICARRNWLVNNGYIQQAGVKLSEFKVLNMTWEAK